MYSLGIDLGSSSVKVSLLETRTGKIIASSQSPESEMTIHASQAGYAEQQPDVWWQELCNAMKKLAASHPLENKEIKCIGIAYQMHGLVLLDKDGKLIRPSIIWCDSRAVESGEKIAASMGKQQCFDRMLNLPGNFTASKLQWVKDQEPENYSRIFKIMLPGDWLAYKLSGEISTTITGLSEGTLWDFKDHKPASSLLNKMGIPGDFIPPLVPVFGTQGKLRELAARELGLKAAIPITYRSGDQPNNAFSLNVLEPGEVAATAGTSGVVYAVSDTFKADLAEGVNAFAHVNHAADKSRLGILLCINGAGIANSWVRKLAAEKLGYEQMNKEAEKIRCGSEGVSFVPFGNGAERILNNAEGSASLHGINFNIHTKNHIYRAVQEGIAFSFNYGIQKMAKAGVKVHTLKAGKANLFQSPVFTSTLASVTQSEIILYDTDGAAGAARGAALGAGQYNSFQECFSNLNQLQKIVPQQSMRDACQEAYQRWEEKLEFNFKS